MKLWIYQNWLALYGAVVGSIALLINFSRLLYTIKKDKIKLTLSVAPHPEKEKNIERLVATEENEPWDDRPNLVEIYKLTVRNIGNVDAHLEDAGIVCEKGKIHQVLVSTSSNHCVLSNIPNSGLVQIQPKASKKLSVYLNRAENIFQVKKAFVVDSTGKKWTIKA